MRFSNRNTEGVYYLIKPITEVCCTVKPLRKDLNVRLRLKNTLAYKTQD